MAPIKPMVCQHSSPSTMRSRMLMAGVLKYKPGGFEADPMHREITLVFLLIPNEFYDCRSHYGM
jgi:hypothetical protein